VSAPETITSEIQKLDPSAVIELFEVDATSLGASDVFRFHSGTNGLGTDIVWKGETYIRYPIEITGFELSAQGQLPRPKLAASNALSAITAVLLQYEDLIGAKVTRKRTHARFLDAVNFDGGVNADADPDAAYPDDIYYIDRKAAENRDSVQFELASSIDLAGVQIPRRQVVQNLCPWRYRGAECGYDDDQYFTENDEETSDVSADRCGKRLTSCKLRFGSGADLPFGGFPGAGLIG
jgi:lambda family phage minor tail protein L